MSTIIHISDLHISRSLIPNQTVIPNLEGHDIEVWRAFRNHLQRRIRDLTDYHVIITGDISSDGHKDCFSLFKQLIFRDPSDIALQAGLQLDPNKVFIVPGNHDSFNSSLLGRNTLKLFDGHFNQNEEYPLTTVLDVAGIRYAVIGFDSTYTRLPTSLPKKLGRGLIENYQYGRADVFLKHVAADYKIVCLHHSPIFPYAKERDWSLVLEQSSVLVSWIVKHKIDMVLFGHMHDDYYDVIPLKALLKMLPRRKGVGHRLRSIFYNTHVLMDYKPIFHNGQSIRHMDAMAYYYIKQKRPDMLEPSAFTRKEEFEKYIHKLDEYKEFQNDLQETGKVKTAFVMAGSVCQENSKRQNSYMEIQFGPKEDRRFTVKRHKYDAKGREFVTKNRDFTFT